MLGTRNSTYRHVQRYKQIVEALAKYGFGYLLEKLGIIKTKLKRVSSQQHPFATPRKVVLMLEELGPTFVKFGQILSTRPDILPASYIEELKKLRDDVEGIDFDEIKGEVERELGSPLEEIFEDFDPQPLAAASLSQVHKAVIRGGNRVVVKVQRPQIEKVIRQDLEILMGIAKLLEKRIPESRVYQPVKKLKELKDAMLRELDFTEEAWNIEKFRRNFEGDESVYVPVVFEEFTTKRVLTMEYIDARKVGEISTPELRREVAKAITRAMMKQVFVHGFFHGDPHPGNIFVLEVGKIAFIDFGLMGRIDEFTKHKLAWLIIGFMQQDATRVSQALLDISGGGEISDEARFRMDIQDAVERYYDKTLKQIDMASVISEIFILVSRYKMTLPGNFTLLLKSIITVEGVGRELEESFNAFDVAKPFAQKLLRRYYGPGPFLRSFVEKFEGLAEALTLVPEIAEGVNRRLKAESVNIVLGEDLEKVLCELNSMVHRIVLALIISSIIIGSSVVIYSNRGPFFMDFPILGVFGFSIAGLLGLGIIVSILRSGRW